jgi:hypothetical protein
LDGVRENDLGLITAQHFHWAAKNENIVRTLERLVAAANELSEGKSTPNSELQSSELQNSELQNYEIGTR